MKRWLSLLLAMTMFFLAGCSGSDSGTSSGSSGGSSGDGQPAQSSTIVFADAGWDTIKFHNYVAGLIAVEAFGYQSWSEVPGSTPVTYEAMLRGDVDVYMEVWSSNIASYDADLADGKFHELSLNFGDNMQGLYVPRYVIEGDPDRGIEPMAPNLKTVKDLANYKEVFPDEENREKGRIYGSIPGWAADEIMSNKVEAYGLDSDFVYFRPGSDAALSAVLADAYTRGEAIVGFYWEPTWLLGLYDFVLLEDEPYVDLASFQKGETAFPSVPVTVGASNKFYESNIAYCEFLKNYKTSSALTSEALAYMQDTGADYEETAKWFLREHDELLSAWLDSERADAVRAAIE